MHHYKETERRRDTLRKSVEVYGEKRALNHAIETALRMLAGGKLSLEEIPQYADLPLVKITELAARQSA